MAFFIPSIQFFSIVILFFKQNEMSSTEKYERKSRLLGEGKRVRMVVSEEPVGWKKRNSLEVIAVNQLRWYTGKQYGQR